MKLEMTIWDNDSTVEEKQEVLLYCERALLKTAHEMRCTVKITNRWWGGFDAEIPMNTVLIRRYNRRLNRLHYWCREDEPLVMDYDWTK